jgi:hypothetical protein
MFGVGAVLLMIAVLIAVGIGAYKVGVMQGVDVVPEGVEGVERVRHVGYYPGFFPFGFLFFPLLFFGLFFLLRGAFWRGGWGPRGRWYGYGPCGPYGPYGPGEGGPRSFEEWHRGQHEQEAPGSEGPPAKQVDV